ncbi:myophilin-like isoform X1 [Oculina patagonica]
MAARPRGHGLSAELARKKDAKYNEEEEKAAREWIEAVLGRNVFGDKSGADDVQEILADGKVLIELANTLRTADPNNSCGCEIKANTMNQPFKKMENIEKYLTFCEKYLGVEKGDQFQTVDLYEKQNMYAVICQLHACGRRAGAKGLSVPSLGPKEAEANVREFTEEQLKEGQNVIGLQMGSNKGASQSGDHYGRPRQIAGDTAYN